MILPSQSAVTTGAVKSQSIGLINKRNIRDLEPKNSFISNGNSFNQQQKKFVYSIGTCKSIYIRYKYN